MEILLLIVSALIGVVTTHYYYRRQMREQVNPIPHIKSVSDTLSELYGMAIQRQDEELQKGIKKLVVSMIHARIRTLNVVSVALLVLGKINQLIKHENEELVMRLKELEPYVERAMKHLTQTGKEFDGLEQIAQKIAGRKLTDMLTEEEIDKILCDPQNNIPKITNQ